MNYIIRINFQIELFQCTMKKMQTKSITCHASVSWNERLLYLRIRTRVGRTRSHCQCNEHKIDYRRWRPLGAISWELLIRTVQSDVPKKVEISRKVEKFGAHLLVLKSLTVTHRRGLSRKALLLLKGYWRYSSTMKMSAIHSVARERPVSSKIWRMHRTPPRLTFKCCAIRRNDQPALPLSATICQLVPIDRHTMSW